MSELNLKIKIDEASQQRAKRAIADVTRAQDTYVKGTRDAVKDVRALTTEQEKLNKALRDQSKAQTQAGKGAKRSVDLGALGAGAGAVSPELGGAIGQLDALKRGISELGGVSLKTGGAIVAVGVALAGVQLAMQAFFDTANEQAGQLRAQVDGFRKVESAISAGLTSSQAVDLIEQLNQKRATEEKILSELASQQDFFRASLENTFGVFSGLVEGFLRLVGDPRVTTLDDELDKARDASAQYSEEITQLQKAIDGGRLSANDAKQATNDAEKAELSLASARSTGADEAKRAEAETQRAQQQAQQEAQRRAEQSAQSQQKYAQSLLDVAKATRDATRDAVTSAKRQAQTEATALGDDLAGIGRSAGIALRENQINALEDEARAYREHYDNLNGIRRDAFRAEREAEANRDFAQLAMIRTATAQRLEEEGVVFDEQQRETEIANREKLRGEQRAQADERRERLIAYQQQRRDLRTNLIEQLQDIRTNNDRRLRDARQAYQAEQAQFAGHLQARVALQNQILGGAGGGGGMSSVGQAGGVPIRAQNVLGGRNASSIFAGYQQSLTNFRNQNTTINTTINGASNPSAIDARMMSILREAGLA